MALRTASGSASCALAALLLAALVELSPRPLRAQGGDTATAEALFEQGKQLLRAGNAAAACPKLAESQRIDPSTGTLLALAMCHEADGKLASAWAEFTSVAARARNENRPDREQAARSRAQALKPRLSTLEVRVSPAVAAISGLEIKRDGATLGSGAWNVVVPVDGGPHVVEVSAPGRLTWRATADVRTEGDTAVLAVPVLAGAPQTKSSPRPAEPAASWAAMEWAGVGLGGVGVIGLGLGGYFLGSALSKKSDSTKDCEGNVCGPEGTAARRSAVSRGNTATVFAIAGGVLAAGGATLFIIGRQRAKPTDREPQATGQLSFGADPAGFRAQYSTCF